MLKKQTTSKVQRNNNLGQNSIGGSKRNQTVDFSDEDGSDEGENPYVQSMKRGRNDETPISFQQRSQSCAGGGLESGPEQGTARGQVQKKKDRRKSSHEIGKVSLGVESSPSQRAKKSRRKGTMGGGADETQGGGPLQKQLRKECMDELGLVDPFKAV